MVGVVGRVTVLIPLYNRKDYIFETVLSVFRQRYPDIELIVIDDGSTDGGDLIIEGLAREGRLQLLRHPGNVNKGQSAALNLGLGHATGEFIAILDSDDLFVEGKLEKQVAFLNMNPDVGLVYGNGEAIDAHGKFLYEINYDNRYEPSDPNNVLMDCYFLLPQNSLVRASVYQKSGLFDEALRAAQDHDMLIRICEVTKIAHQSIDGFRYRRHANSISVNNLELRWRSGIIVLKKAKKRYPYQRSALRKRAAVVNFRLAQSLIKKRKSLLEAVVRLICSGVLDPRRAFSTLLNPNLMR